MIFWTDSDFMRYWVNITREIQMNILLFITLNNFENTSYFKESFFGKKCHVRGSLKMWIPGIVMNCDKLAQTVKWASSSSSSNQSVQNVRSTHYSNANLWMGPWKSHQHSKINQMEKWIYWKLEKQDWIHPNFADPDDDFVYLYFRCILSAWTKQNGTNQWIQT